MGCVCLLIVWVFGVWWGRGIWFGGFVLVLALALFGIFCLFALLRGFFVVVIFSRTKLDTSF